MGNGHSVPRRALILVAVILTATSGCAFARRERAAAASPAGVAACLVVDSDVGLDDFRAVAALARTQRIAAVIATEGISSPARGAMAMAHLLAGASPPVPVLVGSASPTPSADSWLPAARANAERLNTFLLEAIPAANPAQPLEDRVEHATRGCRELRILVIGPWTSFVLYASRLSARIRQVFTQGVSLDEVPPGAQPAFNCRYDLPACRRAAEMLHAEGLGVWVDVPRTTTRTYAPTLEMLGGLSTAGLPGTLRALMLANVEAWRGTLMWDDLVALYVLHPEAFGAEGKHVEPRAAPEEIQRLWVEAVGR